MQDDDYELMPHNELEYLRREVERLKRNPLGDTQASITLLESLNRLNANISRLNDVLAGANDDMVKAYNEGSTQEQIRKILEQQEKLARGIVAVAELVKEVQKKQDSLDIDQLASRLDQRSPPTPAPAEAAQNPMASDDRQFQQPNAPGFMLNPGLQPPPMMPQAGPNINDLEVPLPPRRR